MSSFGLGSSPRSKARRGSPGIILSGDGVEFTSNAILSWANENRIERHDIAPGKPMPRAMNC